MQLDAPLRPATEQQAESWRQHNATEWPELADSKPDSQRVPYPLDLLPTVMQAAIDEVQGATQAPVPLVAQAALATLAVAGQGLVGVARDATLKSPTSLFMCAIAPSGERKTTVDGHFMQPVRDWQAKETERLKPEVEAQATEFDAWKSARTGLLG